VAWLDFFSELHRPSAARTCTFSLRLLDSSEKTLVESPIDPGNDSGLVIRSGVFTGQIVCGGAAEQGRCKGRYSIWLGV
jgi:hypothetical protein